MVSILTFRSVTEKDSVQISPKDFFSFVSVVKNGVPP